MKMHNERLRGVLLGLLYLSSSFLWAPAFAAEEGGEAEEEESSRTGTIIGIDLGTTYSCVAVVSNGKVEIIANDQGNRITPSYVSFAAESGDRLIGDAAKNQATINPENTIFDVKRLIGRQFSDPSVQQDKKLVPYDIVQGTDGKPFVSVQVAGETMTFAPEEVSAMILRKMKETAETFLGYPVHRAVVTVPAYFNDAQRHATKDAGIIAGLHVERIINEPTAAAIAYGMDESTVTDKGETNILVFDLGGGTFDVTLLTIDEGVFEVLATNGDTHLGGEDFDQRVMQYYVTLIATKANKDISQNKRALQRLRKEVERVKRTLSTQYQARLDIEELVPGYDLSETLTRAKFEELNNDLFKKTLGPVKKVMEDGMLEIDEIDEIVLVGGSTRIPKVQELIKEFFQGKEPSTGINPDEAVAYGAAVQGGILSGEGGDAHKGILLLDVTPLSLGTATVGEVMTVIIKRGTTIPTEKSMEFVTTEDNQNVMTIDVYEGERSMVTNNHLLGLFDYKGLPPMPRGEVEVRITFTIDANGILEVTAENKGMKNVQKITINPETGRLSQDDIDRMVKEGDQYAQEDAELRERIEARNKLESFAYSISSTLKEHEDTLNKKVPMIDLKTLEDTVDEMMDWLEENQDAETDSFDDKYAELNAISNPILMHVYSADSSSDANNDDGEYDAEGDDEL
eukprot:CAMPEP_0198284024 /NCGR_PEP_ID=MMETSP1449-20131203/3569_1 /TAXON_ID=420275 /ORGANISM="Attheya septentrionalis, Strain CCMP2084" /LENGTH=683 /DNA_ID=CAMNT_0043980929 /DNA_START=79 /DNA_END=2130 /DNA_ORIENTATION=+